MTKDELLKMKIREYVALDQMHKNIRDRLEALGKQLRKELQPGTYTHGDAQLTVQVKDRTKLDLNKVDDVLRGFDVREYCSMQPDASLIEQLYLEERITDADLREMRDPKYSIALIPKKVSNV